MRDNYKEMQKELATMQYKQEKVAEEQSLLGVRAEKDRNKITELTNCVRKL